MSISHRQLVSTRSNKATHAMPPAPPHVGHLWAAGNTECAFSNHIANFSISSVGPGLRGDSLGRDVPRLVIAAVSPRPCLLAFFSCCHM